MKSKLQELYGIIGGSEKCLEYDVTPLGLRHITYNNLSDFESRHKDAADHPIIPVEVVESIDEAIEKLESATSISRHKISCASLPYDVPSALSVYFRVNGTLHNLAIAGIEYITQ